GQRHDLGTSVRAWLGAYQPFLAECAHGLAHPGMGHLQRVGELADRHRALAAKPDQRTDEARTYPFDAALDVKPGDVVVERPQQAPHRAPEALLGRICGGHRATVTALI